MAAPSSRQKLTSENEETPSTSTEESSTGVFGDSQKPSQANEAIKVDETPSNTFPNGKPLNEFSPTEFMNLISESMSLPQTKRAIRESVAEEVTKLVDTQIEPIKARLCALENNHEKAKTEHTSLTSRFDKLEKAVNSPRIINKTSTHEEISKRNNLVISGLKTKKENCSQLV